MKLLFDTLHIVVYIKLFLDMILVVSLHCCSVNYVVFFYLSPQQSNNGIIKIITYISNDNNQTIRRHCQTLMSHRRSTRVKSKPKYYHLEYNN